jgi:hypothetical protein
MEEGSASQLVPGELWRSRPGHDASRLLRWKRRSAARQECPQRAMGVTTSGAGAIANVRTAGTSCSVVALAVRSTANEAVSWNGAPNATGRRKKDAGH